MNQSDEYMATMICHQTTDRRSTVFALDKNGDVLGDIIPLFLSDADLLNSEVYGMVQQIMFARFDSEVAGLAYFWRHDNGNVSVIVSSRDGDVTEQRYKIDHLGDLTFNGLRTSDSVLALAVSAATSTAFRFAKIVMEEQ